MVQGSSGGLASDVECGIWRMNPKEWRSDRYEIIQLSSMQYKMKNAISILQLDPNPINSLSFFSP